MALGLEELKVYTKSMEIGESIWNIVSRWDLFSRDTLGRQWVRSIDSVAANLSEGNGRFHYKETKQFCYYSRGSLFESRTWLKKAHDRKLITSEDFKNIDNELVVISKMLNKYIQSIGKY